MENLERFLKKNKAKRENTFYAPTASLTDEKGAPLKWEFRHLTTSENDDIREQCSYDVQVTGKPGQFRSKLDTSKYLAKLICASVVSPNLNNKELQDSYGVMWPEDLLRQMVDLPGEYARLTELIQKLNGFDETMDELVEDAKN